MESAKTRAEEEVELWKRRFGELEEWVSKVKADTPIIKLAAENGGTVAS